MAKTLELAFLINGTMGPSFKVATSIAQVQLQNVKNKTAQLKKESLTLAQQYMQSGISANDFTNRLKVLHSAMATNIARQKSLTGALKEYGIASRGWKAATVSFMGTMGAIRQIYAPLTGAVSKAVEFEAAMSKVGAICNASSSDVEKLSQTARKLGIQTKYTAVQSAEAMSFLGMAGWKTEQIIAGMPGLLNLAAAGNTDLARTADIVSDNLTAFGLAADKSGHLADVYAVTITNTNTNIEMLGDTMKYAAPVAHAFGASLEETAALAGIMANSGIKASNAGTSLRTGLMRLAGPPKMASKALAELGLNLSDITQEQKEAAMALKTLGIETGNIEGPRKMSVILSELRGKMKDLGNEEQLSMAKAIFGQQAAAGWLAVLNSAPDTFDKMVSSLEKSDGAAEKMAKTMNDNAKGAATRLSSALESLQISIGNVLLPSLASLGDRCAWIAGEAAALAGEFPNITSAVLYTVFALTGLVVAAKTIMFLNATVKLVKSSFILAKTTIVAFNIATKLATAGQWALNVAMGANPVGAFILGIAAAIAIGYVLYNNWSTVKQFFVTLWNSPTARILMFVSGPIGALIGIVTGVIANWDAVKNFFILLWNDPAAAAEVFKNSVISSLASAYDWVMTKWAELKAFLAEPITATINWISNGNPNAPTVDDGYATGGHITSPTLAWIAEGGDDEYVIPNNGTARARGLWQQAGKALGMPMGRSGGITATFSPNITIQGNADEAVINNVLEIKLQEFKAMLQQLQHQNRRLSYE